MQDTILQPEFQDDIFLRDTVPQAKTIEHREIFAKLLVQVEPVDFRARAKLGEKDKLTNAHYRILCVEEILALAERNEWGLCRNQQFIYAYNGCFWSLLDRDEMTAFLGEAAEKMNVPWEKAKDYNFRDQLLKQFLTGAHLTKKERRDCVLIPLRNGTFEIRNGKHMLRAFDRNDFLTYQLPFDYNPNASCPIFERYLNEVLPDPKRQQVLCEFMGWVFTRDLKLEKTLLLYGPGANGKSVFFDVITALIGIDNISNYSLASLTNDTGYYRAMLANKLVNYASEINGNLEASIFKQLVSGEPVEARLPYGDPMIIRDYAKLIFNTNTLPHDVEHTNAFFRRFLIIPFDVTIPEEKQDPELADRIIKNELPGVFNWVLSGLERILRNRKFTECDAAREQLEKYRRETDTVRLFLDEGGYEASSDSYILLKELYSNYKAFCSEDGYRLVSKQNFRKRLEATKITVEKRNIGNVVFVRKTGSW